MDQLASSPITGRITADPNPLPAQAKSSTTLAWEISAGPAEICVSADGAPENLVTRGLSGSVDVDWIQAGRDYVFRLYSSTEPRHLLDEITVFRKVSGTLTVTPDPNPFSPEGKTVLKWDITAPAIAEVCLSEDGSEERIVARGQSGSIEVRGLQAGIEYLCRLYSDSQPRQLLDATKILYQIMGRVTASPNPIPLEGGSKTVLQWEITPPAIGEVFVAEEGAKERLVCQGTSGSFEVAGLRPGEYCFRLYVCTEPRQLLDELTVRASDRPSAAFLERLKGLIEGSEDSTQLAEFVASVVSGLLRHKEFPKWFRLWEASGFHVTPVHFYEPIPDLRALKEELWQTTRDLVGVDLNDAMQLHLLREVFPAFKAEYVQIPTDSPNGGNCFYLNNGRFEGIDPMIAYCIVRHFRPRHIIEVGGGYSTLLLAQAALANHSTTLVSIEPYPEAFLTEGVPGLTSLVSKKVEDLDISYFARLKAGDCLFIDTSHVVRIGGDVNFLFFEILPRLKPGVIVHVHDIFLPLEYPREWVMEQRRFWSEQYLLHAFLMFNSEFEVLVSSGYLKLHHPEELKTIFPTCAPWQGGSLWMRRKAR